MAYDLGTISSGITDEDLRFEVKRYLNYLDESEFRFEYIREYYVIEEAIRQGYGIEDVASFINWLSEEMDIDI